MNFFDIPNLGDTPVIPAAARVYSVSWAALAMAAGGHSGVIEDCIVQEAEDPDLSVGITDGRARFNGLAVEIGGGSFPIADPDLTNPRWDLAVVQSDGTGHVYQGTPAVAPVPPHPSTIELGTDVAVAIIWVPPGDTAITNSQIFGLAVPVEEPFVNGAAWQTIIANDEGTGGTRNNTSTMALDSMLKVPLLANTDYAIRATATFRIQSASDIRVGFTGPAIGAGRMGFYIYADVNITPSFTRGDGFFLNAYHAAGTSYLFGSGSDTVIWHLDGTIKTGATSGDFGISWAQNSPVAEDTVRMNGGTIEWIEV